MSTLELDRRTIEDALDVIVNGRATYERSRPVRDYAAGRIRWDIGRREVYSYGAHFPLLRYVPKRGRRPALTVLNGDVWRGSNGWHPSRTPDHQAIARATAAKYGASCVIPFSALDGAAIDVDTIRPLEVIADSVTRETVTADRHGAPMWVQRASESSGYVSARDSAGAPVEWTWTETRHRLGDCLFRAERSEVYMRPARPFEVSRETARVSVAVAWRESYCNGPGPGHHVTGPSGACVHCGRPLEARVTVRQRGLYLSSFDYQESPPLYFLAEVPRASGAVTVDSALDALAPRAVHAARARGIPVQRQGDVFFIRTALDLEALEARGIASRARLTMWTRDARPRKGETAYRRPLSARERRSMAAWRRREARRIMRDAAAKVTGPRGMDLDGRAEWRTARAELWRELSARHAAEVAAAAAAGFAPDDQASGPCDDCGAAIGAPCAPDARCRRNYGRRPLSGHHRRELEAFRAPAGRGRLILPGPSTDRGARAKWREARAKHAAELDRARAALRAIAFGRTIRRYSGAGAYRYWGESRIRSERRELAQRARDAREALARLEARGPDIAAGRAIARDSYRAPYRSPVALASWSMAGALALARFYPAAHDGRTIERRRAAVRRALSIYGTAHSATEVLRTRAGAVYVRGTVRHIPDLEPGRGGTADHRPLELGADGALWLAVRNAVPRQRARRSA